MKKATNSALMRLKNEKIVMSLINQSPISRAEIAKKTGLTKAAVTIIVDDLKRRNIIIEGDSKSNAVGRSSVMLHLNRNAYYVIGVNITRKNIYVGIVNLLGEIMAQEMIPVEAPDISFLKIKETIDKQLRQINIELSKIYKLAVVTPGPVDAERGVILNPPNFKRWHNVPVVAEMKKITGFDVVFENVSSAIAIAEKYFGVARDTSDFLILQVDEGIGSGIIINDLLFKGPCELGHTSIKYDGIKCECGNRGCLEKYASIPHILEKTPYKTWVDAVENDDEIVQKEADYLSCAIISANNVFSLKKIVLCGDLSYKSERIIELILDKIKKDMLSKKNVEVCAGKVESKYLIASAIAIHDLFA